VSTSKAVAILHYSVPPIVGGVESVIQAHVRLLSEAGYRVSVLAGKGRASAFAKGVKLILIPEMSTRNPEVVEAARVLEQGQIPASFEGLTARIESKLVPALESVEGVIVHNVFSKHFNLPLTAALVNLLDKGKLRGCIAWCHDITWTSPHSRSKVFPGYPWDLLRTPRADIRYVTISRLRQRELAELFHYPADSIAVVYNGVDPQELLGLSAAGRELIERLGLWEADLVLLMPVRVTQAKNIELAIRLAAALKARGLRPRIVLTGPPDPHDPDNMAYFQSLLALRRELGVESEMRFVYTEGPDPSQPRIVDMETVGELYRASDALFMPSHREGFGMPLVEAALAGLPVFCSPIPAAEELGGADVTKLAAEAGPEEVAALILERLGDDPTRRLRKRARQTLTWRSIFERDILPLLEAESP
jgi:glycosyltransferase involved in cell wall biosynthesis